MLVDPGDHGATQECADAVKQAHLIQGDGAAAE